ncbi:MAG TPA: serine hydrolase domain-containing protein [Acidimicrobiales bacterium]|nr:serine hydrolase domain-containing protein [Acidimicrobiales bacterium]
MPTLVARLTDIQDRLDALARRHRVPGATLAIAAGDELLDFATGVLNVNTGVETTTDSVFQIGSNTKLLTTTLVMQLVDAGRVDLDAPVRTYLPDFELADRSGTEEITVRQLLTHTSGIQGDYFDPFGRGDEAIERYVASLRDIDLVHRPGSMWSYCNSGFVVAGRLVEVLSDRPYRTALKERITAPLGLRKMTVVPDEMIANRCAVGHVVGPSGPVVPPTVVMEYAQAPAGSMTTSTAAELVRFVQMHLAGGVTPSGDRILSEDSVRAMQQVQFPRPPTSTVPLTQGLGWLMEEWDGRRVIGHGGGTIGQLSFLEALPDDGLVVALLTNSMTGGLLWRDLGRWLFEELAGVRMPSPPKAPDPAPELDLSVYAGTYERLGVRYRIEVAGGELVATPELTGSMADLQQGAAQPPLRLRPIDRERFVARIGGVDGVVLFLDFERGRPGYVMIGRVARRVRTRAARTTKPATAKKPAAKKAPAKKATATRHR